MLGVFGRIARQLTRDNAGEWHSGQPEIQPPQDLVDEGWKVATEAIPNRMNGRPVTYFRGDALPSPVPVGPPPTIPSDSPPTLIVTYYNRARHGEGMFG